MGLRNAGRAIRITPMNETRAESLSTLVKGSRIAGMMEQAIPTSVGTRKEITVASGRGSAERASIDR
jgi:hypothetical protein